MEESHDKLGFYELHGRKLVYSVPKAENIKLICKNATTLQHSHTSVSITGVGIADIAPDCQIILPNDRRIFSNPMPLQEKLGEANFMHIFNYLPELDNYTIEVRDQSIFNHTVISQLQLRPVETYYNVNDRLFNDTFSLRQFLPEAVRVMIGVICVLICLLLPCFCFPKFRTWFKTFILWKNPAKWYTHYRGMDMTTWTRRGTKFYKSCKDVEKNKQVISKVLDSNNRNLQEFRDMEQNPITFGFSDPIAQECAKRVNDYAPSPGANKSVPKPSEKSLYPTADIAEPLYSTPTVRCSSVDANTRFLPESIPEDVEMQAYNTRRHKMEPPVIFNDTQNPTINIVTAPGYVDRLLEESDGKLKVSRAEKSAINSALTQTSMRNTPEPVRRNLYHPHAPPVEINYLANVMRENNLSSLNVNSAGLP